MAVLRPREGGLRRGLNFVSALLQPSRTLCVYGGTAAGAQCLRLSERFFIVCVWSDCDRYADVGYGRRRQQRHGQR